MKRRILSGFFAALLCTGLCLGPSARTFAQVSAQPDTVESETAKSGSAQAEESGSAQEAETGSAQTQESGSTQAAEGEQTAETESGQTQESSAGQETPEEITGFVPLADDEKSFSFSYYDRPTQEEISDALPDTIQVYLNGSETAQEIPVSWESTVDYDATAYFYYSFHPVWDTGSYSCQDAEDAPYIWVEFKMTSAASGIRRARAVSAQDTNKQTVYQYLTQTMGLNKAAACGVMANIEAESNFYPGLEEYTERTDKGYGLCQWTFTRRTNMEQYMIDHGYTTAEEKNFSSIQGQLEFMYYELQTSSWYKTKVLDVLRAQPNTAQGAYQAGYTWCYYYEVPQGYNSGVSADRGQRAIDNYWTNSAYGEGGELPAQVDIKIQGASLPDRILSLGSSFDILGTVSSTRSITYITVGVYDRSGSKKMEKTVTPGSSSYSIGASAVNSALKFGTLSSGDYLYKVTASSGSETVTLVEHEFSVRKPASVTNGTYYILCSSNQGMAVQSAGTQTGSGLVLAAKAGSSAQKFTFTGLGSGKYKITSLYSGKVLEAAQADNANVSAVVQTAAGSSTSQQWRLWQNSDGSYLLQNAADGTVMEAAGGKIAAGTGLQQELCTGGSHQKFTLAAAGGADTEKFSASISSCSFPGRIHSLGSSFSVRGTIKASRSMSAVSAAVYDGTGKARISKTVSLSSDSYDLKNLDSSLKFGSLPTGDYRYEIKAVSGDKSVLLVKYYFSVRKAVSVSGGSYLIVSKTYSNLLADIAGAGKAAGANLQLALRSPSRAQNFTFISVGGGKYKITDAHSGKVLESAGGSSADKANVCQGDYKGTLFQQWKIWQNSDGSYLLQNAGSGRVLTADGTVRSGANLLQRLCDGRDQQKFVLTSAARGISSTLFSASLSSGSLPDRIHSLGSPFSVRGNVTANKTIMLLDAAVFNGSGKRVIGKTVIPAAKSYNLQNLDSSLKFGSLPVGDYHYQVRAVSGAQCVLLVNYYFSVRKAAAPAGGTYLLVSSANRNLTMDLAGGSLNNGANIQLWRKNGTSHQTFTFTALGGGKYKIVNTGSGKAVESAGGSSAEKANIDQSSYSGSAYQQWRIWENSDGSYVLQNVGSSRVMTAAGSLKSSVNLWQQLCDGGSLQKFVLQKP